MSSLSISRLSSRSSLINFHSSSSKSKSKFIWRFPPLKFDNLPSCTSKYFSTFNIQPLNINDELIQRQQVSILIYELGSNLNISFNCIYTGVVYMHRYFMLHPFQQSTKELVGSACLFLACKVHEMPRPLNEFSRYLYEILNNSENCSSSSSTSDILLNYNQQIIDYENILLSTLGFCLNIEQPYLIISRICQILSISMEIAQNAYEIATKSIFFTLFSMKYTNNLIACFALYLSITLSNTDISDNEDGSQWFHLINEEFTEKLLQELKNEYEIILTEICSKQCQQRFEQIRQQKFHYQQNKSKPNCEKSNSTISSYDNDQQHYPIATTSGSVRSTTSSSSIQQQQQQQQQQNVYEHGSIEVHHHTPARSSLLNVSHNDYSPSIGTFVHSPATVFQSLSSPKQNLNGQYHSNNSSILISSAKPIPTLMTSTNSNSYQNSINSHYHSRYSVPMFNYPSALSPTQRVFRPPPPPPIHSQQFHAQYPSTYAATSSYYPQQQTPLFYHPQPDSSNINNKRYGEPPAAPTKRFRYNINPYQHY